MNKAKSIDISYFNYKNIEKKFDDMSEKGWHLYKASKGIYYFEKDEFKKLDYKILLKDKSKSDDEKKNELNLLSSKGLTLVCENHYAYIFVSGNNFLEKLDNREAERNTLKSIIKSSAFHLLFIFMYLLFLNPSSYLEIFLQNTFINWIIISIIFIIIIISFIFALIDYYRIKKNNDEIKFRFLHLSPFQSSFMLVLAPAVNETLMFSVIFTGYVILMILAKIDEHSRPTSPKIAVLKMVLSYIVIAATMVAAVVFYNVEKNKIENSTISYRDRPHSETVYKGLLAYKESEKLPQTYVVSMYNGLLNENVTREISQVVYILNYEGEKCEYYITDDNIPLKIEDLISDSYPNYTYVGNNKNTDFISFWDYLQVGLPDSEEDSTLNYSIIEGKYQFVTNLIMNDILKLYEEENKSKFQLINNEKLQIDKIYKLFNDKYIYLLVKDKEIVTIELEFELNKNQLETIISKTF